MKIYVIAGEASGDMHGANLLKQLKIQHPNCEFRAWGGDRMEAVGAQIVKHYRDLAFMGFIEVIANLRTILKNIDLCKNDIKQWKPDAIILIDYPGFNMRIGPFAKALGIKVLYYISPQIWAWKQNRVFKLREFVDRMYVILPFEKDFYARFDMDVDFVGHPLLDSISEFNRSPFDENEIRQELGLAPDKNVIAILPGSRKQEVSKMLSVMIEASKGLDDYEFVIAAATSLTKEFFDEILAESKMKVVWGKTYPLLRLAHSAMVTSGTATLETALFKVPQVVCYKGNQLSYLIARQLIKVKYISLVNLIMDKKVVQEMIQSDMNAKALRAELIRISEPGSYRNEIEENYHQLIQILGGEGASEVTAKLMLKTLGVQS